MIWKCDFLYANFFFLFQTSDLTVLHLNLEFFFFYCEILFPKLGSLVEHCQFQNWEREDVSKTECNAY